MCCSEVVRRVLVMLSLTIDTSQSFEADSSPNLGNGLVGAAARSDAPEGLKSFDLWDVCRD